MGTPSNTKVAWGENNKNWWKLVRVVLKYHRVYLNAEVKDSTPLLTAQIGQEDRELLGNLEDTVLAGNGSDDDHSTLSVDRKMLG